MKIDEIPVWEAFYGVAKHGNFSKAAQALRVTVPQLSKRVAKLEGHLGVRLFQRSTRSVALTDEGKALMPKVGAILDDLQGVESLFERDHQLSGTVRVTCVPFVAHRLLIPVLSIFTERYPDIRIELDLSEGVSNLIESNVDLALRIDEPGDSDLVYRKIASNDLVFCASPGYLKASKFPLKEPQHLKNHRLLMLHVHRDCRVGDTQLRLKNFAASRKITCENGWFLTELALRDLGVLVRSIWDVQEYIRTGQLVQVLKNHRLENFGNIYVVIPSRRFLAPRVRLFMDFVVDEAERWRRTTKQVTQR